MPEFARLLIAAVLGSVLVLAGYWYLNGSAQRSLTAPRVGSPEELLAAPVSELASAGVSLEAQVAGLQRSQQQLLTEVAQLRAQLEGAVGIAVPTQPAAEVAFVQAPGEGTGLSVERLAAAGVPSEDAEALIQRLDELALARLEASYRIRQAATSGDPDVQRAARDARRQLPADSAAIREEFGDSAYDSYLYASGQANRVEVSSVLRSSTAVDAGIEPGDYLRSLDGQPLYNVRDLTARIREGSPEETYALSLERNGQTIEVWVPGGPLGVRVTGAAIEPGN